MRTVFREQLIELILKTGMLDEKQIASIMLEKQTTGKTTEQILIDRKIIKKEEIGRILEEYYKVPYIDLTKLELEDKKLLRIIPEQIIRKYRVLPVSKKDNVITIAMSSPNDIVALEDMQIVTGYTVKPLVALESSIVDIIEKFYVLDAVEESVKEPVIDKASLKDIEASNEKEVISKAPLVKLVDNIMAEAVRLKASDIHVEPQEKSIFIRYRVDGLLSTKELLPKAIQSALTSRIKVMAEMDITEKRFPQDGQIRTNIQKRDIDFRVSTLPSKYGEKIVIRVLDKSSFALGIENLGFPPETQTRFEQILNAGSGIILVTGPTGSGKTTTLYSVLNRIKSSTKNIITLEDPIEYGLLSGKARESGITQVQINSKIGFSFAKTLRASLRQDPDIILVGEIRDEETCRIAINAALMGHLVFSTIHTNDAVSTINRLLDMEIEPFLIASSLIGVLAQRLVRTLCSHCKEMYHPPKAVLESLNLKSNEFKEIKFYRPKGCKYCDNIGYKGRIGIFELLTINESIRDLILGKAKLSLFREVSGKNGMITMKSNGVQLVARGITTMAEIFRVLPADL